MKARDTTHLVALSTRLAHEKARLAADPSELRKVWVAQIEKEIAHELAFLRMDHYSLPEMSDDELLRELQS